MNIYLVHGLKTLETTIKKFFIFGVTTTKKRKPYTFWTAFAFLFSLDNLGHKTCRFPRPWQIAKDQPNILPSALLRS